METPPRTWHIYTLADPRDGAIRYVGWSVNPRQRLNAHVSRARLGGSHKYHWIAQLLSLSLRPVLTIVETGDGDWREAECRWIARFTEAGCRLTNLTDGGEGAPGYVPTAEARARMSAAHLGRKQTPESIAKLSAALRGRKHRPERSAMMSAKRKGRAPVEATKAAAAMVRGRKQSPEHVAKRMRVHRKVTPEMVRVIRAEAKSTLQSELASRFGLSIVTVSRIQRGLRYSDIPQE